MSPCSIIHRLLTQSATCAKEVGVRVEETGLDTSISESLGERTKVAQLLVVNFEKQGGVALLRNGDVVKRPADPAEV